MYTLMEKYNFISAIHLGVCKEENIKIKKKSKQWFMSYQSTYRQTKDNLQNKSCSALAHMSK